MHATKFSDIGLAAVGATGGPVVVVLRYVACDGMCGGVTAGPATAGPSSMLLPPLSLLWLLSSSLL